MAAPNYGLGTPQVARDFYHRAGWTLLFTAIVWWNSRVEFPGPAAQVAVVLVLVALGMAGIGYALTWYGVASKADDRERILGGLAIEGAERVLEVGCGLGYLGIAVAQRLKSGKVIGLGSTETNDAARENAKSEGVADKIRFESGDVQKLSYPDAHFDAVIASRAFAGLGPALRDQALREMTRVLKSGGRLVLLEAASPVADPSQWKLAEPKLVPSGLPAGIGTNVLFFVKL